MNYKKEEFTFYKEVVYIDWRFEDILKSSSLKFGEKLKEIGANTFSASGVRELDLSDCSNLRKIDSSAFKNSNLERIILPFHITSLSYSKIFCHCKKLKEIISPSLVGKLEFYECPLLEHLIFSPSYDLDSLNKHLIQRNLKEKSSYSKRVGVVMRILNDYSVIWCFSNFKFYRTDVLPPHFLGQVVWFYHLYRTKAKLENGNIYFYSNYDEYYTDNVFIKKGEHIEASSDFFESKEDIDFLINYSASNRYRTSIYRPEYRIRNYQNEYINKYQYRLQVPFKPIKEYMYEIDSLVDSLNIDKIINSYHSTTKFEVISEKIGGDDKTRTTKYKGALYTDAYLETFLPNSCDIEESKGYGYYDESPKQTEKTRMEHEDECIRERARMLYNKEEHKKVLIQNYIQNIIKEEVDTERFLHLKTAESILSKALLERDFSIKNLNSKYLMYPDSLKRL